VGYELQVDVIETWERFVGLKQAWEAVYEQDGESGYFLSWAWLAEVFRENPNRWRVLAVKPNEDGSDYICFFPQRTRTRWSVSRQQFKTELEAGGKLSWAQYTGFVCLPAWEERAIAALASAVGKMPWAELSIKNIPREGRLNLFLAEFATDDYSISHHEELINSGTVDSLVCPYVPLPKDYESYLQSRVSSNTRQKMRRFWRQFEAADDLRITDTTAETFDRDITILLNLWFKTWSSSRGESSAEEAVEKYIEILDQSHSLGAVNIPILWRGEQPLGALGNIVDRHKRHLYFIVAGRDESVQDPNVGLLLHTHNIQWAINNGIETYDFCHGNEPYKYSFGATDRRIASLSIARTSKNGIGQFDPRDIGKAMNKAIKMLDSNQLDDAKSAFLQIQTLLSAK
jgi:Acetyltransferase (GNAT) domain